MTSEERLENLKLRLKAAQDNAAKAPVACTDCRWMRYEYPSIKMDQKCVNPLVRAVGTIHTVSGSVLGARQPVNQVREEFGDCGPEAMLFERGGLAGLIDRIGAAITQELNR